MGELTIITTKVSRIKALLKDYSNTNFKIQNIKEAIKEKHEVPALAAAIAIGDRIVAAAATGERRYDSEEKVRVTDAFQIGSITYIRKNARKS